ncbi:MFS general substrate transporter [Cystobasidium minutum MCA 4210]|uniref:MFS general substrate transporter n=1 Tax=Cystobasidium minutum MCA 4210 TaxID=1397322 RepID=UPI0034CF3AC9|eukprot:jgi/Rhomi1/139653/e_gw1.1.1082.1
MIVNWDGPDDPKNPINFSEAKKWTIMITIGTATLACTCASSMVASTYEGMMEDFNVSREVATLSLTLFICGLGSGPLVLAPLSEFYGRRPIYVIGYFIYSCFSFLVAFGNFPGLLVGRFIQGVAGSAFLSVAGGSVSDLWTGPKVGRPMAIYSACPFLGPVLGPLIASFINQSLHWRWTWYISTIWNFAELALIIFLAPETYAPRMLKDKAARLRKETGNPKYQSAAEIKEREMGMSKAKYVWKSMGRPFQLLLFEPMVFLLCLWCALLLGILYAFFSAFPIIFRAKGFNEGQIGLSFLGMGLGILIATILNATYYTSLYAKTAKRLGHKPPPEEHLKKGMVAAVIGPISLFAFAWTSQPSVHWAAPVILSIPFGVAFTFAFTCSFTYKVDAYRPYAASAMGANSFMRSSFAAGYPLFTVQMYNNLGVTWAGTLNAFLLLALTPCPFLFYKYGARLRKRSRFSDEQ